MVGPHKTGVGQNRILKESSERSGFLFGFILLPNSTPERKNGFVSADMRKEPFLCKGLSSRDKCKRVVG
jgi:hypothetical protein